jgi:hypothetical protein
MAQPFRKGRTKASKSWVTFRCTAEEYDAVKKAANSANQPFSSFIRTILLTAIAPQVDLVIESKKKEDGASFDVVPRVSSPKDGKALRCWHGLPLHQCFTCQNI